MVLKTLIKFILNTPLSLIFKVDRTINEHCRAAFVSTALSSGLYKAMTNGARKIEDIQNVLEMGNDTEALRAWLDLGVSLGELRKSDEAYFIKGSLSKKLLQPSNDAWQAYFQSRAEVFYDYIIKTPALISDGRKFPLRESYGELFARSSRTVEPILFDVISRHIPKKGPFQLLEVGCGSGVYIKRACEQNPDLHALGLELQPKVAHFAKENIRKWEMQDRVRIINQDIRQYSVNEYFDLVTFHNLIYYFPPDERTHIFQCMRNCLEPGGQLIITTLMQGGNPPVSLMNLWASMTEGCGPLPDPEELDQQLRNAGLSNIRRETLIPGYVLWIAERSG